MNKMSPDEKITAIALEQPDPFARSGQLTTPLHRTPFQQRDFSHLDEPADVVKKSQKAEKKKPAKTKALGNVEPVAEPVPESRPNDIPPCPAPADWSQNRARMECLRTAPNLVVETLWWGSRATKQPTQ